MKFTAALAASAMAIQIQTGAQKGMTIRISGPSEYIKVNEEKKEKKELPCREKFCSTSD